MTVQLKRTKNSHCGCCLSQIPIVLLVATICLGCAAPVLAYDGAPALWEALQSGNHFALLRHAIAPGTGYPP